MSEVLGLLFAVILGLSFIPTLSTLSQNASNNTRAATTAQQQRKLIDASSAYIQQYSTEVQGVATATTPAVITVPMLQAVKLLDASFSATNPFGQTWQTEVLQPSAGNLQAFVMSYGGTAMNDMIASKIAGLVGAQGGFIPKNDSSAYAAGATMAYGTFGGWTLSTANYTSVSGGHLAGLLTFNNGQLTSNYLYRNAVPGQPQLNQMNTALDMGGNNLNNAGTVSAAGGNVVAWNQPTEGGVLTLKGANGTKMYVESLNGKFRLVNDPWNAELFSVNQNGNVAAAGKVSVPAGNNVQVGSVYYYGDGLNAAVRNQPGGATYIQDVNGNPSTINAGAVVASNDTYMISGAVPGTACSQDASVRRDATTWKGLVVCGYGQWQKVGGGVSSITYADSGGWQPAAVAYCPAGYTLTGGSCDMYQAGDGREISPRACAPAGNNGYYCNEGNGGYCIAHAVCAQ
ncbi:shufflon system plasmid conjugative transfer pilus tip adhesin PilV [Ralstonia pseudosolanacearum]